jgi:hypothetical protein
VAGQHELPARHLGRAGLRGLLPGAARRQLAAALRPDPAIYLDQSYWAELQRRNTLQGGVADLNALRQEQPVRFEPEAVPPPLQCS